MALIPLVPTLICGRLVLVRFCAASTTDSGLFLQRVVKELNSNGFPGKLGPGYSGKGSPHIILFGTHT